MPLLGLEFSEKSMADLAAEMLSVSIPEGEGPRLVFTANVDHIVHMRRQPEFRAAYQNAWVRTIDGFPVHVLAKIAGSQAPRFTGSDLFAALMPGLDPLSHRCFFIANSASVADGMIRQLLNQEFQRDSIQVCVPPFGFELDTSFSNSLAARVRSHRTTHLFLGVGAPKSEIWCHRQAEKLGDCYALSLGSGLELYLGLKPRAPRLWRRYGFEWLWRFIHEPRRLFRRYFVDSWGFLPVVLDSLRERAAALHTRSAGDVRTPLR
jgi:N-acetylglucosaminyldiphosphoundecaprenol N-acetyl-beta-D-mannosaminyltransferase